MDLATYIYKCMCIHTHMTRPHTRRNGNHTQTKENTYMISLYEHTHNTHTQHTAHTQPCLYTRLTATSTHTNAELVICRMRFSARLSARRGRCARLGGDGGRGGRTREEGGNNGDLTTHGSLGVDISISHGGHCNDDEPHRVLHQIQVGIRPNGALKNQHCICQCSHRHDKEIEQREQRVTEHRLADKVVRNVHVVHQPNQPRLLVAQP